MAAASAPASPATLPPPGVGCLAAVASRNSLIVLDWSYMVPAVGWASPTIPARWALPTLLSADVMLHTPWRQVHGREGIIGAKSRLDLHQIRGRSAHGHHTSPKSVGGDCP